MERHLSPLAILALLACGAGVGFAYVYRASPWTFAAGSDDAAPAQAPALASAGVSAASVPALQAGPAPGGDAVAGWIEDAAGEDPGKRVVAIAALGGAPAARALPVLRQVLDSGDAVDRPLALNALRELALKDGDAAGSIREVLRVEVYDGNDETFVQSAQAVLTELDDRLIALR